MPSYRSVPAASRVAMTARDVSHQLDLPSEHWLDQHPDEAHQTMSNLISYNDAPTTGIMSWGGGPGWHPMDFPHVKGHVVASFLTARGLINKRKMNMVMSNHPHWFDSPYSLTQMQQQELLSNAKDQQLVGKRASHAAFIHVTRLPRFLVEHCWETRGPWSVCGLRDALSPPCTLFAPWFPCAGEQTAAAGLADAQPNDPIQQQTAQEQEPQQHDAQQLGEQQPRHQQMDGQPQAAQHRQPQLQHEQQHETQPLEDQRQDDEHEEDECVEDAHQEDTLAGQTEGLTSGSGMPWCPSTAYASMQSSLGSFNIPTPVENRILSRYALTNDQVNEWPVLKKQLSVLLAQFTTDIVPGRGKPASRQSTMLKNEAAIKMFLGHVREQNANRSSSSNSNSTELRLECLLDGSMLQAWTLNCLGPRRVAHNTMRGYLSNISQVLRAMQSMNLEHMRSEKVQKLIEDLSSVQRQIGARAGQQGAQVRLAKARLMSHALASPDAWQLAAQPSSLRHALVLLYTQEMADQCLAVYDIVPRHLWKLWAGETPCDNRTHNIRALGRQIVTCWWRAVQVGLDLPPLRASMVMSLHMPHSYPRCPEEGCSIPGCKGNQVVLSSSGAIEFLLNHHKSVAFAQQVHGGPICPSPPKDSTTYKLTLALVECVLPMAYADMAGVPESVPLPMLPDLHSGAKHLSYQPNFKSMSKSQYTMSWKDACLGRNSVMVQVADNADPLGSLELVPMPFMEEALCGFSPCRSWRKPFVASAHAVHGGSPLWLQPMPFMEEALCGFRLPPHLCHQHGGAPGRHGAAHEQDP